MKKLLLLLLAFGIYSQTATACKRSLDEVSGEEPKQQQSRPDAAPAADAVQYDDCMICCNTSSVHDPLLCIHGDDCEDNVKDHKFCLNCIIKLDVSQCPVCRVEIDLDDFKTLHQETRTLDFSDKAIPFHIILTNLAMSRGSHPMLQELKLDDRDDLTNDQIKRLLSHFPQTLKTLSLKECSQVTEETIREIIQNLPELTTLNIIGTEITRDKIRALRQLNQQLTLTDRVLRPGIFQVQITTVHVFNIEFRRVNHIPIELVLLKQTFNHLANLMGANHAIFQINHQSNRSNETSLIESQHIHNDLHNMIIFINRFKDRIDYANLQMDFSARLNHIVENDLPNMFPVHIVNNMHPDYQERIRTALGEITRLARED